MALKFVLLTLLDRERKTGYEIVKTFESAVGYFWSASHQQVYRELSKLTDEDLVIFTSVKQGDKPDKKVYRITAAGKHDLQEWLQKPLKGQPSKDLLLVKLLNLRPDNVSVFIDELDRAIKEAEERGAVYSGIKKRYYGSEQRASLALEDLALYFALRKGISSVAAHIKWLKETRAEIAAHKQVKAHRQLKK